MNGEPLLDWLRRAAQLIHTRRDELTRLDAAIGDADHGVNMDRGFAAIVAKLDGLVAAPPGRVLTAAGATLISTVGGASGPLWGTALRRAGRALGDAAEIDATLLADALDAALEGVRELGGAAEGDKTMIDALGPATRAFRERVAQGGSAAEAAAAARDAAEQGMRATIPLQARKGRASYLGERSIGHQDPGATSTVLLFAALAEALGAEGSAE